MPSSVRIRWHGEQYKQFLMAELRKRMQTAASVTATTMTQRLSRPSPPPAPIGEPPHMVTGTLRRALSSVAVTTPNDHTVRLSVGLGPLPRYTAAVLAKHPTGIKQVAVGAAKRALNAR